MIDSVLADHVTGEMLKLVRPVVTPLSTDDSSTENSKPRLVGSGSYVIHPSGLPIILTCEHVAREYPSHFRFLGHERVWPVLSPWCAERPPIDLAITPLSENAWSAHTHKSMCIPYSKFAERHETTDPAELLFFCGFSGENAFYWSGEHAAYGSGYLSQEVTGSGNERYFEVHWDPSKTQYSNTTSDEARASVAFNDARGFSGSLVWNTRFFEVTGSGGRWTADDARVTGMLHRWDDKTLSLLAIRVEHIHEWLALGN